jgi:hypothetical protein
VKPTTRFRGGGLFHGKLDGETTGKENGPVGRRPSGRPGAFEEGFLLGLLVGEGHFGGDGRQPQVTLRMHVRHEALFRWIEARFPGGRLYGPYRHGGRHYYQWMARGSYLRERLVPLLHARRPFMDDYTASRFDEMCARYGITAGAGLG